MSSQHKKRATRNPITCQAQSGKDVHVVALGRNLHGAVRQSHTGERATRSNNGGAVSPLVRVRRGALGLDCESECEEGKREDEDSNVNNKFSKGCCFYLGSGVGHGHDDRIGAVRSVQIKVTIQI